MTLPLYFESFTSLPSMSFMVKFKTAGTFGSALASSARAEKPNRHRATADSTIFRITISQGVDVVGRITRRADPGRPAQGYDTRDEGGSTTIRRLSGPVTTARG